MKNIGYRWWWLSAPVLSLMTLTGCHEDGDEVDGVLSIIFGVFDLVLGIIAVAS